MLSKNLLYHTLDLTAGFWNLPVKESHRERLAFVTSKGKWEFNVLPFGLMTGPSYMQRMIEATLVGLMLGAMSSVFGRRNYLGQRRH